MTNALEHAETLVWDVALGLPTRVEDANGRILNLRHDALGREISRERAWDGVTETTAYAACGGSCGAVWATASACGTAGTVSADLAMMSISTSPVSPTTLRYFDELGRGVRTAVQSFGSATVHRTADVLRDGRGLVACASAPYHTGDARHFERHAYDVRGRPTSLERAGGGGVAVGYAADAANRGVVATVVETVVDADGGPSGTRRRVLTYDVLGDLVKTAENPDAGMADDRSVAAYVYDGGGLLESVTVENGTRDHATTFAYDAAGNRTGVTGPDIGTRTFGYTALGELRTSTDGRGKTMWMYDVLGRPTKRNDPRGGVAGWVWDTAAKGLPARRTYDDGATSAVEYGEAYAYDAAARPTTVTTTIRTTAASTETFTRTHAYDDEGRPSRTVHPSGLAVTYGYNARGYLSELRHGTAALVTYAGMDAWGNPVRETYGNGVSTARTFDAATGRATGIDTAKETAAYQAETYGWRSDGLLGRRTKGAHREDFAYDPLGRLKRASTRLDGASTAGRTLAYGYDALGNLTSKTSDVAGDADAATYAYGTGSASPTRLLSAVLGGRATTFAYDADGHVERHDAATGDDAFVEWNGRGLPSRITVGATAADAAPKARDEFRYGPAGERYHRRITWREELADGTTRTRTAEAYRVGAYERVVGDAHAAHARVEKTHVGPALAVRTSATSSAPVFEYVHADHLGSAAAVTDASGAALLSLAHDPYGTRRRADWTGQLPAAEAAALAAGQDAGRARSGFTGHEPLDRTGFVHMNGRLYDPRVGRFMSPDPVVSRPWSGQGWNPYSYVQNSPLSFTDPTGYIMEGGCIVDPSGGGAAAGALGGFTSVAASLWTRGLSFRIPIYFTVQWRSVSFSVGGSLGATGSGDDRSYAGVSYRPWVTVGFGPPTPVWWSAMRGVALAQEATQADGAITKAELLRGLRRGDLTPEQYELARQLWRLGVITGEEYWDAVDPPLDSDWASIILDPANWIGGKIAVSAVIRSIKGGAEVAGGLSDNAIDAMLRAGSKADKNRLNRAGRGLQKHGDRPGSVFPRSAGTAAERNAQGLRVLEDILKSPRQLFRKTSRGTDVVDMNTGRGVRFNPDGSLRGFLEPP